MVAARPASRGPTPLDLRIYGVLQKIAAAGQPCPTNKALAEYDGINSAENTMVVAIRRLTQYGMIEVEMAGLLRRIRIVDSGEWTAFSRIDMGCRKVIPTSPNYKPGRRKYLCCGQQFASHGPGNRMCDRCRKCDGRVAL